MLHQSLLAVLVPYFNDPLRSTGDENVWYEGVPLDVIDRRVVSIIGVQILGAVLGCAQVDHAFICSNQECAVIIRLERNSSATI